jgi:ABC-2 type transport system permease protein
MDAPVTTPAPKYRRWLPYWAVLQTDVRQTLRSWVYRVWVLVSLLAALGYLLYRFGIHREAGIIQSASVHTSDLLRGMILGSLALIVVLTVSSITSERGTLADSVLSRGISRYQYFLAKWHARAFVVLTTFSALAAIVLVGSYFLLSEDLSLGGSVAAIVSVAAILLAIVSWGVAIGALTNSTVLGITLFWIALYGVGFLLSFLPASYPAPDRTLSRLPHILRGNYDPEAVGELLLISVVVSAAAAVVGMLGFARKDV